MKIALDYDKTYTADPDLWDNFLRVAKRLGHEVRIVTIRDERYDRTAPLIELEQYTPVVYTRGVAKKWFCTREGWAPDIYIDDAPETILYNSETTPEDLAAWRAGRGEASA
jgi:hypothetical protein